MSDDLPRLPQLLRPQDVADALGVSKQSVYNLVTASLLRAVRFRTRGGRDTIRFRREDVSSFVEGNLR
jgi:excisionase family DNA binding protein